MNRPTRALRWAGLPAALLVVSPAAASGATAGHADPVAPVLLALAVILVVAKLGGDLAIRLGQPSVLGELVAGILLGNLGPLGVQVFEPIKADPSIDMLSSIGVIILLFEVGLESTVDQMLKVGAASLAVATLGVVAPFALGWGVAAWLLPEHSIYLHMFIGATLTATSVGITARVLKDLGRSQTPEARIILGAAVLDDVMGLTILAVVTGVIVAADRGETLSFGEVGVMLAKAVVFLAGSLAIGVFAAPRMFALASRLRTRGVLLAVGLAFCFLLAWLASVVGLAPIVGAFAAGLILENVHYRSFVEKGEHGLVELVEPISSFLVPVFFVLMGMRTDVGAFFRPGVLGLAAALVVAAIVGKQACSLGAIGRGVDRLSVGIGMIPRGEVGLIFANIGMGLTVHGERIVDSSTFSAIIVMVLVTTLVTPPALEWSLGRRRAAG
jgi:Kef-type K+ transport system membrane component KefB